MSTLWSATLREDDSMAPPDDQPTTRSATNNSAEAHSLAVLPMLANPQSPFLSPNLPSWAREVGLALTTRPSRASSIISTRTRFSTTTIQDDARSIDINLGGHHFRISRDGSRITSEGPPPPYFGPEEVTLHAGQLPAREGNSRPFPEQAREGVSATNGNLDTVTDLRANILNPAEVDMPSPVDQHPRHRWDFDHLPHHSLANSVARTKNAGQPPARNPSYTSGAETITLADTRKQRRTVSQNDLPDTASTPLRRRNGVRLPTLMIDPSQSRRRDKHSATSATVTPTSDSSRHHYSRSAGPVLLGGQYSLDAPASPTFIGRDATGVFPVPEILENKRMAGPLPKLHSHNQPLLPPLPRVLVSIDRTNGGEHVGQDDTNMDDDMTDNFISDHYTRMIRFIDRDHRRVLHARDKELEELRERLNEVDTVYRAELRARDFTIEDLKKRLAHLEQNTEIMLEKARHQVEDIWERRWQELERMRRNEAEAQRGVME